MTVNGDEAAPRTERVPLAALDYREADAVRLAIITLDERLKEIGEDVVRIRDEVMGFRGDVAELRGAAYRIDATANKLTGHMAKFQMESARQFGRLFEALSEVRRKHDELEEDQEAMQREEVLAARVSTHEAVTETHAKRKIEKWQVAVAIASVLVAAAGTFLTWWLRSKGG